MRHLVTLILSLLLIICNCHTIIGEETYDVCVYGGTSAGVIAAYSAKMLNKKVILIEPSNRLGGLTSGGLGFTDIGNKQVVTGLSKDFYRKVGQYYGKLEQWVFEPSVAKKIFEYYIQKADVQVLYNYAIASVNLKDQSIKDIWVCNSLGGGKKRIYAKMFIDCSYEGDLMAKSKVSYIVGRENNEMYGELYNGVQLRQKHQFPDFIDPFKIKGDSTSGLIWGISSKSLAPNGSGDKLVQAYNFRICLTNNPENRKEITQPDNYDASKYELLLRLFDAQPEMRTLNDYFIWSKMPNNKTDINNRGGFSTDMIGMNYHYPEASLKQREKIIKDHRDYTQGLLYFIKTDSRVPAELQQEIQEWGYPIDEYTENNHWSPQLYVRETRRMIADYVMTQANCEHKITVNDGIGMAAYTMDSHNCQRVVIRKNGKCMVKNEGNVEIGGGLPYPISYRSIIPKKGECKNILVPVCLSASHIAYGSIRMEPVFMVLAQSAAVAAVEALSSGDVHDVDISKIQNLLKENPLLDYSKPEILIDDDSYQIPQGWSVIKKTGGYGASYVESNSEKQDSFSIKLNNINKGKYKIFAYYQSVPDLVDSICYKVSNGKEAYLTQINKNEIQIEGQTSGTWVSLGTCEFYQNYDNTIDVFTNCAKGKVIVDAFQLIPFENDECNF